MSVLDKFLNVMKLNDEDTENDGYLDDPEEDYVEQENKVKRRIIRNREEDDLFAEEPEEETVPPVRTTGKARSTAASARTRETSSKISPIRSRRRNNESGGMEVCVIRPHTMEDAREITETLLAECTVVLNVEGLELELAQRIIDFASGSCYAIDGNLQKISSYIFIITPASVDISGDFQEILSGAFDVPFEKRY